MASLLKNVADYLTPVLSTSQFTSSGVLTPQEFETSGDQLTHSVRTWKWESAPQSSRKDYLSPAKQYLITRNVPCACRATVYESAAGKAADEEVVEAGGGGAGEEGEDEGWLSTHTARGGGEGGGGGEIENADMTGIPAATRPTPLVAAVMGGAEDEEIGDIDDVADDDELMMANPTTETADDATLPTHSHTSTHTTTTATTTTGSYLTASEPDDNIVRTRTYDLSITYDKFYRTPRVWLFGYDEHRHPLTTSQIMEDVSADHAGKTVTVEVHPFLGVAHASIHPCKHASVMKRIVEQLQQGGGGGERVDVRQYMFIFLKFISSVIPTIQYDFTMQ